MQWANRGGIFFFREKMGKLTEIHHELIAMYIEHVINEKELSVWCSVFTEKYMNLQNR